MLIPEVRALLLDMAKGLETLGFTGYATRTRQLVNELHRRPRQQQAPQRSKHMTPAIKQAIRHYHQKFPLWTQQQLGEFCGVSAGRVSETLNGKRT